MIESFGSLEAALDEDFEQIEKDLFVSDYVTGNAFGSYTFNTWTAEEFICHNLDIFCEACDEFGSDPGEGLKEGAEFIDVTIRCYLLSSCLDEVFTEIEKNLKGE